MEDKQKLQNKGTKKKTTHIQLIIELTKLSSQQMAYSKFKLKFNKEIKVIKIVCRLCVSFHI